MLQIKKHTFSTLLALLFCITQTACVSYPKPSDYPAVESAMLSQKSCIDINLERFEDVFGDTHRLSNDDRILSKFKSEIKIYNLDFDCEKPIKKYKIEIHSKNPKMVMQFIWLTGTFLSLGIIPFYMTDRVLLTVEAEDKKIFEKIVEIDTWVSIFLIPKMILSDKESHETYHARLNSAVINFQIAKAISDDLKNKVN